MSVILIVDDRAEHAYFLQALLAGHGFDVLTAPDGAHALALAKTSAPDLIVSDILMPVMDGFAFCQACKKDARLRSIPFVFYTATYTDPRDEKLALNMGADRFLIKPMEPDALLKELRAVLAGHGAATPSSARELPTSEVAVMREYNQALVRKLELKLTELEEALRQGEENQRRLEHLHRVLHAIFESASDGILLYDTESRRFVAGNRAISQMLGYSPEELLTLTMEALHPEDKMAEVRVLVDQYMRGGLNLAPDVPMKRKDGTAFLADVNATVFELDGRRHLLGIFRDVTAHKNLEAQLLQSQKLEVAGQLAGGVAHDFNNLLTGIIGYTELCLNGIAADHPIRPWLNEITREVERSANLSRQLLAFARKQAIAPKIMNLNEAVEGMLKMLRRLIGEPVDIAWQPAAALKSVKIDPGQVDQIIANLCVNARDAMGGAGKVTLETANVEWAADDGATPSDAPPGSYVLLAVSDDGCGMNDETMAHLFEPFFTTKRVGEGTGLGLSTVYGIVKQNNGFIRVHSEPGKGSTFRIYFPCCAAPAGAVKEGSAARTQADLPGGRERILLVEDEKSIRVTTQTFLAAMGYTVQAADHPEKALRLAAECPDPIHLLITDVVMPGLSGRELACRLVKEHPDMKCLFMSGYTADLIAHRGILDEGVAFLSKPFSRDALARKVRAVLDEAEASMPHPEKTETP